MFSTIIKHAILIRTLCSSFVRLLYYIINSTSTIQPIFIKTKFFFRLSSRIAESLKSLFVLFASDFIQNAAELLTKCVKSQTSDKLFTKDSNCTSLVESIIQTLYFIFMHDSQGFVNIHRFEILLQPLVDQLGNLIVLENEGIREKILLCLAQLATAANDDTMWKQLNYQILLKTRDTNSKIR